MAQQRDFGTMDFRRIEVAGDEPDLATRPWIKATQWHGRCNREWQVTPDPSAPMGNWKQVTMPTDTLHLAKTFTGIPPGGSFAAAMRVSAEGNRKGFLWLGVHGKVSVELNGSKVAAEESTAACHVTQFKVPIELRSGENRFLFRIQGLVDAPQISALLVGPQNDGDSVEGIQYLA
jgi:hypothetical protein